MNLNYILIWLVCLSCLIFLVRSLKASVKNNLGWIVVSSFILLLTLILAYFKQNLAGLSGLILWLLFLVIPLSTLSQINQLLYQEKYTKARKLAQFIYWLHPCDGCKEQPHLLRALEIAHQGNIVQATQIIDTYQTKPNAIYRQAKILLFWLQGDWENCLIYLEKELTPQQIYQDSNLFIYYLRALGENGKIAELLHHFILGKTFLEKKDDVHKINTARMLVFAFCGKPEFVQKIFIYHLSFYTKQTQQFWIATAQLMSGNKNLGLKQFNQLKKVSSMVLINNINWRLSHLDNFNLLSEIDNQRLINSLNHDLEDEINYKKIVKVNVKTAYFTKGLIIINTLVFFIEIKAGGSTNLAVLEAMGALIPEYMWQGEWWRLITANFLHYGWLHLSMNMMALWIVGTFIETLIGSFLFFLIYAICGIGGMLIFTIITPLINPHGFPLLLVGASGAIMGLVGIILAIFIKFAYGKKSQIFAQKLRFLLFVIFLQFFFDFINPQVSFVIHALGFMLGFMSGLLIPMTKYAQSE